MTPLLRILLRAVAEQVASPSGGSLTFNGVPVLFNGSGVSFGAAISSGPVKVMMLGDSITAMSGASGYREQLWHLLAADSSLKPIDFVGNNPHGPDDAGFDQDNNGNGGYAVRNVLLASGTGSSEGWYFHDSRDLDLWFNGQSPDIVLMHFGSNDCQGGDVHVDILTAYSAILARARVANPNVKFIVSQIIPTTTTYGYPTNPPDWVVALNNAIPGWASSNSTTASPILVLDQWTGFNAATQLQDAIHPNASGAMQMATRAYSLISSLTKKVTAPPPAPAGALSFNSLAVAFNGSAVTTG